LQIPLAIWFWGIIFYVDIIHSSMENPPNPNEQPTTWRLSVSEEGIIELPEDLLQIAGWSEGNSLYFHPQQDGSIIINDSSKKLNGKVKIPRTETRDLTEIIP
jgi:hypothetical protein